MFFAQHRPSEATPVTADPRHHTTRAKPHNAVWRRLATRISPATGGEAQPIIQAKLTVVAANDKHEQEADQVADHVMGMPDPRQDERQGIQGNARSVVVQRVCAECQDEVQRQSMDKAEDPRALQMKSASGGGSAARQVSDSTSGRIMNLRGAGEPLSRETRSFFEPRFGRGFGHVRVHADARAAEAAQLVNAKAFTSGHDVVFGAGAYSPETEQGKSLLAHELTHVVQQDQGASDRDSVQRQEPEATTGEQFLIKMPAGGVHLKAKPYAAADNFPGDKAEDGDVVMIKNTGGAATYNNVKNGTWSWIEIPGKSSPDSNYPVLHGFIQNAHIAGLTVGPVESRTGNKPAAASPAPASPAPATKTPESCPENDVDDAKVQKYIDAAIKHAAVAGGWDVEKAFGSLQAKRCVEEYCCDQDLAAAEHYMFSRYMVGVEGYPLPVWSAIVLGYAGAKAMSLVPSLCQCPVTPTSWAQIGWALSGGADGEHDGFVGTPP